MDMNVEKDWYKWYDGLIIWSMLGLIVYPIWRLMLRVDTIFMMDYEFDTQVEFDFCFNLDTNVGLGWS